MTNVIRNEKQAKFSEVALYIHKSHLQGRRYCGNESSSCQQNKSKSRWLQWL